MSNSNKDHCPVCGSVNYQFKKKSNSLDLGYCIDCSLAYAQPLLKGGG